LKHVGVGEGVAVGEGVGVLVDVPVGVAVRVNVDALSAVAVLLAVGSAGRSTSLEENGLHFTSKKPPIIDRRLFMKERLVKFFSLLSFMAMS
jgi:hypothetical protein